jgi:exodeoxyribonuclease VII small subunit
MDKQSSYTRTRERLEEIVAQVKAKDMPLEKSLDLYEEALRLGSVCAEMIDRTDFSIEELQAVELSDEEGVESVEGVGDDEGIEGESEDAEDAGIEFADADEAVADAADEADAEDADDNAAAAEGAAGAELADDAEGTVDALS